MGFIRNFKNSMNGEGDAYEVEGIRVVCSHCGCEGFNECSAQLNTRGATFFNLDWMNGNAAILECIECGHMEWFMHGAERVE